MQCFFYLSPDGELILEDSSRSQQTEIVVKDSRGNVSKRFQLRGEPKRRAIPRTKLGVEVYIVFSRDVHFTFKWNHYDDPSSKGFEEVSALLPKTARKTQDITRGQRLPVLRNTRLLDQTTHFALEESCGEPFEEIHDYKTLGQGQFGTVSKSVDRATGLTYAVKTCIRPSQNDPEENWKRNFIKGPEAMRSVRHVS